MRRERSEARVLGQHRSRAERWYDRDGGGVAIACAPSLPPRFRWESGDPHPRPRSRWERGEQQRALRHDSR